MHARTYYCSPLKIRHVQSCCFVLKKALYWYLCQIYQLCLATHYKFETFTEEQVIANIEVHFYLVILLDRVSKECDGRITQMSWFIWSERKVLGNEISFRLVFAKCLLRRHSTPMEPLVHSTKYIECSSKRNSLWNYTCLTVTLQQMNFSEKYIIFFLRSSKCFQTVHIPTDATISMTSEMQKYVLQESSDLYPYKLKSKVKIFKWLSVDQNCFTTVLVQHDLVHVNTLLVHCCSTN